MDFSLFNSIATNEALLWWSAAVSVVVFVASLVSLPFLVALIPDDYFIRTDHRQRFLSRHLILHLVLVVLKNLLGLIFLVAGIAMLFLPGQGLLTMVMGILLLNFPGKPAVVLWLIQRRPVLKSVNWLRQRRQRPPLQMPEPSQ